MSTNVSKKTKELRDEVVEYGNELTQEARRNAMKKRDELAGAAQENYSQAGQKIREVMSQLGQRKSEVQEKVGHRLDQYNEQLSQAAEQLPGDIYQTIERYRWVALLTTLGLGLMLGFLLRPGRRS